MDFSAWKWVVRERKGLPCLFDCAQEDGVQIVGIQHVHHHALHVRVLAVARVHRDEIKREVGVAVFKIQLGSGGDDA